MSGVTNSREGSGDASRQRDPDRLDRLQRVSLDLNAALSIADIATSVIEVLDSPMTAPSRSMFLLDESGEHLVLVAHRGLPPDAAEMFRRFPVSSELPGAIAVRQRRTVTSMTQAEAVRTYATLADVPRSTNGFAAVPLVNDDTCVGVLGIGFDGELDDRDLGFFEAVAAQVAQTVLRVRLIERERRRRAELEFLSQLTTTALAANDHIDLMRKVCAAAVPTLGDWCSLYFVPEDGGSTVIEFAHVDPEKTSYVAELHQRFPFDAGREVGPPAVIRTGKTQFVPRITSQAIDEAVASANVTRDEALTIVDRLGITSAITVPLRTKRRTVGAMQFVITDSERLYDADDVALAEAVGGRLAEALDAAWMADHQRLVSVLLQEALLPPALPSIPGAEITARYWPAGIDQVGGDFYDVFAIDDATWVLLIGDVCGSGPDAAALTSIVRHTARAAARHGCSPEVVIEWLNEAVLLSNRDQFCTVCYATLTVGDAGGWILTTTAAGHPLPILSSAGATRTIGRPGSLLGVFDRARVHTERTELNSGDVLVLYTDGITDLPPPLGITSDQLTAIVHSTGERSAHGVAESIRASLLERVPDRSRRDDVAVIVAAFA
jgi:serine phosphatase RsbU (regulator of sigma subunit)